jgi:acyl phosphate:glycerol-3-phosphate acyltransferase
MALILLRVVVVLAAGYLIGGVPFGPIVSRRMYHIDITALGSGNTGATNVFRNVGWKPALVVAISDVTKGAIPAILARLVADPAWGLAGSDLLVILAGVAAMIGHMYSPYFKLRGGKGVATAAGAIAVLMPWVLPVLVAVFAATIAIGRIVSVASIVAALSFPLATWLLYGQRPVLLVFALAAVPLIVWAHRSNIGRLMRGEEPRITMGRAKRPRSGPGPDGGEAA